MQVNIDKLCRGAAAYYEAEICRKASGIGQFASYFMLPSVPAIIRKNFEKYRNNPMMEGVINPDGQIDLDEAKSRASDAMEHCGSIEISGFRLGQSDIDELYEYIRGA